MSSSELYADSTRVDHRADRRVALTVVLALLIACALGLTALFIKSQGQKQLQISTHGVVAAAAESSNEAPPPGGGGLDDTRRAH